MIRQCDGQIMQGRWKGTHPAPMVPPRLPNPSAPKAKLPPELQTGLPSIAQIERELADAGGPGEEMEAP